MIIRHYQESDLEAVKAMHKFQYELPTDFLVGAVLENGTERPEAAGFICQTAEVYLLMDDAVGSKRERLRKFLALHAEMKKQARFKGITDLHCYIPPEVEKFGKVLEHLGWVKSAWASYYLGVK
jgi:hypothetical protein